MNNFGVLVACLLLGILLRALRRLPQDAHVTLNSVIVNVALPALTFASVRKFVFDPSLAFAVAMPWLVFVIGGVFFVCAGSLLRWKRSTIGCLLMTACLGNTSFLGLPLIETFFGRESMRVGLLIDQFGSYLVLSTVGIAAAAAFAGHRASLRAMARRVFAFPPFIALILTLVTVRVDLPPWVETGLLRLGDSIPMLAMLSVGCQLRVRDLIGNRGALALGLVFKLVLVPALIAALYLGLLPGRMRSVSDITIFESAMGPMLGGAIVAAQYELNASLTSLMVGVGVPLSLLTVPLWWFFLQWLQT